MKIFKVILILILLFSISFGVYGRYNQPFRQGEIIDWQKSYWEISERMPPFFVEGPNPPKPDTLLEWFKNLSLEEKVEIYNWWKDKNKTEGTNFIYFIEKGYEDIMPFDY